MEVTLCTTNTNIVSQIYLQLKGGLLQVLYIKKVFPLVFPSPENIEKVNNRALDLVIEYNYISTIINNKCQQV